MSAIWSPRTGVPAGRSSSPVTRTATCGRRTTATTAIPRAREDSQILGSQNTFCLEYESAGRDVLAATADVAARRSRFDHPELIVIDPANLDRNNRVGRGGQRGSRGDLDGLARTDVAAKSPAGSRSTDNAEKSRRVRLGTNVSSPLRAKPSMAARSKGGTGSADRIGTASTRPAASPSGIRSAASVPIRASIEAITSPTDDRARKPRRRGSGSEGLSGNDSSVMAGCRGFLRGCKTARRLILTERTVRT